MRGLVLFIVFFSALPFIFLNGPYWGILIWYWISLMNPQEAVWGGIFGSIPYALVTAVATFLSWLMSRSEPKFPPLNKTTCLLVSLGLWVSVTSIFGTGPADEIYEKWDLAEKMLLMTIVAFTLTTTRERLDQLIAVCALSIAFWGVKGGLGSLLLTGGTSRVYGPPSSMLGDNNDLGVALTMILPLLFYIRERFQRPSLKWPFLALIGCTFLGDILTYSRGALVALLAMGGMLWWRSRRKIASAVLIAFVALGVWNFAPAEWLDRMGTIEDYKQDSSAETRIYLWHLSWDMAMKRPITGAGFQWSFAPHTVNRILGYTGLPPLMVPRAPHSIWFEMLGNQGFVGLAIFIAILVSSAVDARWLVRQSRGNPDLRWANTLGRVVQASLIGYCAGGSFATQGMFDGFYALVIIVASARRIAAAQLASRDATAIIQTAVRARVLGPQPTG
ncbi:MAG TPA: putative O-glycosylation ligase, exosortase A system-associated [Stellaceae bacterium]|jgi:probable O-glycosylation ligase (exosortase A-associated)|nr:putative O-glycosylation ligase, exosortase A system-associated [Stellaceae bacterium]